MSKTKLGNVVPPYVLNSRHHKLRGILADPGDNGGEEGGRDGNPEERQDAAEGREKDGEAESQTSHG